jgi:probable HAF family extracellular repeat protein
MNFRKSKWISAAGYGVLLTTLAVAMPLAAQEQNATRSGTLSRYLLKDLGTAGGPNSDVQDVTYPINNKRMVTIIADTPLADPFDPYCFADCFIAHAAVWQRGTLTDLGALTPGASSAPNGINAAGTVTGLSETGVVDPTFDFPPEFHAVVWKDGRIIDLGTFGGTLSYANAINDLGQVVGFALNGKADAFITGSSAFDGECGTGDVPSQMRAFVWQEGRGMRALGTLGGPDSCAKFINRSGQIAGISFTSYRPNAGSGIPNFEPFIWTDGKMTGLGSLGGTQGHASAINNLGQVAGDSNLAGDEITHAFFWDRGQMTDVVPGSDFAVAEALNDKGEVVGGATSPGDACIHAFLWRDGVLIRLKARSNALGINSSSQVVGQASMCGGTTRAFLWEKGRGAVDLDRLVPPGSGVILTIARKITDNGEITAQGTLPNGDEHAFLLIPRKSAR